MSEAVDLDSFLLKINENKIVKFTEWCQDKNLDANQVIGLFIDGCLEQNLELISHLFADENNNLTKKEVELIIMRSLQPLLSRLDKLENNDQQNDISSELIAHNQDKNQDLLTIEESETNEENRKYLPRHQVWQMLKQTDYIKYCGYDSFLVATPEQFVEYGIFFDERKKRYYVEINT